MPLVAEMESSLRTLVPQSPHINGSFTFHTVLALGLDKEQMFPFLAATSGQSFFLLTSILSFLKFMLWELILPFLVALIYWLPGHSPLLSLKLLLSYSWWLQNPCRCFFILASQCLVFFSKMITFQLHKTINTKVIPYGFFC